MLHQNVVPLELCWFSQGHRDITEYILLSVAFKFLKCLKIGGKMDKTSKQMPPPQTWSFLNEISNCFDQNVLSSASATLAIQKDHFLSGQEVTTS